MSRQYRTIVAPTIYRLEELVNVFLATSESNHFAPLGPPQVFNHEEYVQTFISYGDQS